MEGRISVRCWKMLSLTLTFNNARYNSTFVCSICMVQRAWNYVQVKLNVDKNFQSFIFASLFPGDSVKKLKLSQSPESLNFIDVADRNIYVDCSDNLLFQVYVPTMKYRLGVDCDNLSMPLIVKTKHIKRRTSSTLHFSSCLAFKLALVFWIDDLKF